jgi:hypothetical protein
MMIGIIPTVRPIIDRRKTILGNHKRVEPKKATLTNRFGKDEFISSSTQPDSDFLELYLSAVSFRITMAKYRQTNRKG